MSVTDSAVDVPLLTNPDALIGSLGSGGTFFDVAAVAAPPITRGIRTPLSLVAATFSRRDVRTPLSLLGATGVLLLQWNDLAKLSAALPLFWNDQNAGLNAQIVLNWNDLDTLIALPLVWRVIPNVQPLFSADVQKPTATVVETP